MSYQHLTQSQRYQIATLHREGVSGRTIGRHVVCHHSTVAREIQRNAHEGSYRAVDAQRKAVRRRHVASSRLRIDAATWAIVDEYLREDWSPEQIVGRGVAKVSHERIYRHIAEDRRKGGDLWTHRRRRGRRRRIGTSRERQRFHGRRIQERPASVDKRRSVGHWEGDSVVGKGAVRLITLVERKSLYIRLQRVLNGTSEAANAAMIGALHPLKCCVQTLTQDNGSEFAGHALVDIALDTQTYFADPHSPWQRGRNENANGLVRQYVPKGTCMDSLTDEQVQAIEDKLNNRPRKTLGFKTPSEVFFAAFKRRAS